MDVVRDYYVRDVAQYINWTYFFHAWQFPPKFASVVGIHNCDSCRTTWVRSFPEEERERASEALKLFKDANEMLSWLDEKSQVYGLFHLFEANSENEDVVLYRTREDMAVAKRRAGEVERTCSGDGTTIVRLPFLRQQTPERDGVCYCVSDFIRPVGMGGRDKIGVFATTVGREMEELCQDDEFNQLLVRILADRLAEATAEKLHEEVRKMLWGYAPNENLTMEDLHNEKFQGTRPAVGYPCLPDISLNFLLDEIVDFSRIGISLTEHAMMRPHASVSGLMMAHPASKYFAVGTIDESQFRDYASRRKMDEDVMRTYLGRNLATTSSMLSSAVR